MLGLNDMGFSPSSYKLANVINETDNQNMFAVETKNKVKGDLIIHSFILLPIFRVQILYF